jgi:lipopolysaccharide export system permease protein
MRRIERYLAAEIMRPLAGTLVGLTVIVFVFYASKILAEAVADRFSIEFVGRLVLLRLGMYMDVLLPVALLLGIVLGLGRLQTAHEMTAVAALGAGKRRVLVAVAGPVLGIALLAALTSLVYRPWAFSTVYRVEAEIASRVDLAQIEAGRFTPLSREWLMFAERRSDGVLENVLLRQRHPDAAGLLRAERLHQETDDQGRHQLVFAGNVHLYRLGAEGRDDLLGRFDRLQVVFTPPPPPVRERLRRTLSLGQLYRSDDPMYTAELQWRLLAPLNVLLLGLAGVALGRIDPRRGQSARVLSASLVVTFYFSLLGALMNALEQGHLAPWPGAFWLPLAATVALALRYQLVHRGPGGPL